jgi:DNA replication protein DnaC
MKTLSSICEASISSMKDQKATVCDYIMTPHGCAPLKQPILSTDYECLHCNGREHFTPYVDPTRSDKRVWLCANHNCDVYTKKTHVQSSQMPPLQKRALEWPKFCEINGIGDLHHDVKFEKIEQSQGKIDYLFKFADKPCGIILMQGTSGSGKTYSSMGVCELFTRRSPSAIFTTQTKMLGNWIAQEHMKYTNSVESAELLVVDDFGTGEVTTGFMKFFLDLINTRMQWSNRGTIITTNLNDKDFSDYCGSALNDRMKTGQKFEFKEKSRRKQIVL